MPSHWLAKIRARDAEDRCFARAGAIRKNVVENPAVAGSDLVDQVRRKDVGFRHYRIAPVVFNVLVAAKGVGFRPRRRTAGDKVRCLVVAEAREDQNPCWKNCGRRRTSQVPSLSFLIGWLS